MLELRFWRGQADGKLPEDLGVSVQRVAGGAPGLVGEVRPLSGGGHCCAAYGCDGAGGAPSNSKKSWSV